MRLGVNIGPVDTGIAGVKKFASNIWGDTVNIASRMESSDEARKVNVCRNTYALIQDEFDCVHRGKINAKAKVDMYLVEGRRGQ